MRKDVYERMRYFVLEKIRPNYSAIARQYDVDPRTVKAAYVRAQSGEVAVIRKRRVNTDLKLSEITGLKMYFFTGLNMFCLHRNCQ
ncbi:hypothetical protein LTY22_09215 [Limosilactobacillus agrestis]|nr:hypothetical protein [Limosilactobacillus agrestis]MCD7113686.1 hypothetical protein [Limosilactobacillus agrestis]